MATEEDGFAVLEEAARRQTAEEIAVKALNGAIGRLLQSRNAKTGFFANLACRLERKMDWGVDTGSTNGSDLKANPDFVNGLTPAQLDGFLCHEALHCGLLHPFRLGARNPELFNTAADLSINSLLLDAGLELPDGKFVPGKGEFAHLPAGLSVEDYYQRLSEQKGSGAPNQQGSESSDSPGSQDPGGNGGVEAPPSPSEVRQGEAEWRTAVLMAAEAAKGKGELGGGIESLVGKAARPPVDWRDALRDFVAQKAKNGRSWNRVSRRHLALGMYLPGRFSRELGDVVLFVDTSGSTQPYLEVFGAAIADILEEFNCSATVVYHDVPVTKVAVFEPGSGEDFVLEPMGGGGTSHEEVFGWLAEQEVVPSCVIALTDADTTFPAGPPEAPVLWAIAGNPGASVPFGEIVHVTQY